MKMGSKTKLNVFQALSCGILFGLFLFSSLPVRAQEAIPLCALRKVGQRCLCGLNPSNICEANQNCSPDFKCVDMLSLPTPNYFNFSGSGADIANLGSSGTIPSFLPSSNNTQYNFNQQGVPAAQGVANPAQQHEISLRLSNILNKVQRTEEADEKGQFLTIDDAEDLKNALNKITETAKDTAMDDVRATRLLDIYYNGAIRKLNDLFKDRYVEEADYLAAKAEIKQLYENAYNERINKLKQEGREKEAENAQERMAENIENAGSSCPTSEQVRARYHSGCWACLVLEKLTSSFLWAAKYGLEITQAAGKSLLIWGSLIWLTIWALKNVSSFTQIELGNILNDLIRFLFKFAVAYWFISYGPAAIRNYFITPMMSVGAQIGQQFWHSEMEAYVDSWDSMTEEDQKEQQKEIEELPELQQTPIPQETDIAVVSESNMTEQDIQEDIQANTRNEANFAKKKIPNLLIPGTKDGCLSSPFGCRPRPCTGCSKCHKGVDVGLACTGKREAAATGCVPVLAAGPGTIEYKRPDGKGNGAGHTAYINHGKIGGHNWKTSYFHMKPYNEPFTNGAPVRQGDTIGCIGSTGVGTAIHLHFQVFVDEQVVDPLALPMGHIVYLNCDTCTGSNRTHFEPTVYAANKRVGEGFPAAGEAIENLNAAAVTAENVASIGSVDYDSLIVHIPEIKYTGPVDIMPKSVMNSILGATRAITDTTADIMVMGNMMMCYSSLENGGAWKIKVAGFSIGSWTNWIMWLQGGVIWCLGFMLTVAIGYYLVDISFKIGFAVLAVPIVMGLWPFNLTQGKLFVVLSIIAKSSATFAFLALTTRFGLTLVGEAVGGLDELYRDMDRVSQFVGTDEKLRTKLNDTLYLFSPQFVLLCFGIIYFFKLVQQTISDLVNKFFPDQAFGDSSPMHSGATMMTDWAKKATGIGPGIKLAGDIAATQTGNLLKKGAGKAGKAVGGAVRHPVQTAKKMGNAAKSAGKAIGAALKGKK